MNEPTVSTAPGSSQDGASTARASMEHTPTPSPAAEAIPKPAPAATAPDTAKDGGKTGGQDACGAALPGVFADIGALPPGALVTEAGLARILGKCTASIRHAVDRGELPRPARLMGKNTWTAGAIVRHHEARLEAEARKFARLRS